MSSLALVPNTSPQVIEPQSFDVHVLDFECRAAAKLYRQSSARIMYYGWRLRYAMADDWSPLGVKNEEAAYLAEAAGLDAVMDRCVKIEHARLFGGLNWVGVDTKVISARRPKHIAN